jgi:hypothetical protein
MVSSLQTSRPEIKERLASLTEELSSLHRDLYWLAQDSNLNEQETSLAELSMDDLMAAKLAVDNLRDILWNYVDAMSKLEPERVQEAMQNHRLRRTTRLLELLRKRMGGSYETPTLSFIERISAAVKEKLADDKAA